MKTSWPHTGKQYFIAFNFTSYLFENERSKVINGTKQKMGSWFKSFVRNSGHLLLPSGPTQSSTCHTTRYEPRYFWWTIDQPIATLPQLVMRHTTTHMVHFEMVMLNQQFSQVSFLRNNDWMLQINWCICSSDMTTNTNYAIIVHKRFQFVQRTGLS